ncbi:hypothetical protein CBM2586_U20016 [Cupriavidus phytorum]|uniref:Uncharacterized protein n=1 Tax=Cupriavidus taiwanensis TaxID=164546 RepID=A0A375CSD6_9BURK|nr:hypothetical protein CBM2586_U20016 [Cupriavidus taiwanensis]SOZ07257.1 hypothetical protein CBM2599_U10014 [Cupriavidus taiwanensis]SOZ16482.1 hypothetical protein CBM2597_P30016 [Cupriavidus taiwanensis]
MQPAQPARPVKPATPDIVGGGFFLLWTTFVVESRSALLRSRHTSRHTSRPRRIDLVALCHALFSTRWGTCPDGVLHPFFRSTYER